MFDVAFRPPFWHTVDIQTDTHTHVYRPVRRILKRGDQSTAWPLGHGEGEGAGGGCAPSCAKREVFTLWI